MGIGILINLIVVLVIALVIRWIRIIKINSEEQIQQNKELITLLKEIKSSNGS